jgi:hypothetical protein
MRLGWVIVTYRRHARDGERRDELTSRKETRKGKRLAANDKLLLSALLPCPALPAPAPASTLVIEHVSARLYLDHSKDSKAQSLHSSTPQTPISELTTYGFKGRETPLLLSDRSSAERLPLHKRKSRCKMILLKKRKQ